MRILGYFLMAIGGMWIFYIRLTNIDVTETRLLIDNYFSFLVAAALVVGGYLISEWKRK